MTNIARNIYPHCKIFYISVFSLILMDSPYELNAPFLADLVVDDGLLQWHPPASASDLAKRVIDVFRVFQERPEAVTYEMVKGIVDEPNAQIQNRDAYMIHVENVGRLFRELSRRLLERVPDLDLPPPTEAYARGLMHDISAAYSDYKKTGQESKEIDLYFHARHLGMETLAHEVAMHGAYLEILELIFEGAAFPHHQAYAGMRSALRTDNLHHRVQDEFTFFRRGHDNLPLMVLTMADYLAVPRQMPSNVLDSPEHFDELFAARMNDLVVRYYTSLVHQRKRPSAFGTALIEKNGTVRADQYKTRIKQLLFGRDSDIESLRNFAPMLWKPAQQS